MPDIIKLYDELEKNMGKFYKNNTPGKKYGSVSGVSGNEGIMKYRSRYFYEETEYLTPFQNKKPTEEGNKSLEPIGSSGIIVKVHVLYPENQKGGRNFMILYQIPFCKFEQEKYTLLPLAIIIFYTMKPQLATNKGVFLMQLLI